GSRLNQMQNGVGQRPTQKSSFAASRTGPHHIRKERTKSLEAKAYLVSLNSYRGAGESTLNIVTLFSRNGVGSTKINTPITSETYELSLAQKSRGCGEAQAPLGALSAYEVFQKPV